VEYDDSRTLFIESHDPVGRKVQGVPIGSTRVKIGNTDGYLFCDADDEEAENGNETLLNELNHWDDGKEGHFRRKTNWVVLVSENKATHT